MLGIFTATGTGWINPKVADSLEYLHRGDTAEVSMQYSFLPSWLSFLVDQTRAEEAGQALIGAVLRRVDELPPAERPKVLVFGESLGSYGTEQAFDSLADLRAKVDGALLAGPTFANPIWDQLIDDRAHGSPQWLPALPAGTGASFARTPADLAGVAEHGVAPRVVYLQNASDPVTWWSLELAYRKPDWAGVAGGAGPAAGIPLVPDRDVLPGGDGPGGLAGGTGGTRALLRVERGGRVGGGVEAGRLERRSRRNGCGRSCCPSTSEGRAERGVHGRGRRGRVAGMRTAVDQVLACADVAWQRATARRPVNSAPSPPTGTVTVWLASYAGAVFELVSA